MTEILHLWALAPAAVGTCCLPADRRRVRAPELTASALMLIAMLDAATVGLVATVFWAGMLLLAAMALAGVRSGRRRHPARRADTMTVHTALGLVVMAALLLTMPAGQPSAPSGHAHGMDAGAVTVAVGFTALGYVGWSAVALLRAHTRLDRAQYAAMGVSVLAMVLAVSV